MKRLTFLSAFGAALLACSLLGLASGSTSSLAGQTQTTQQEDYEIKLKLLKKFKENFEANAEVAYETAKEYLKKFPAEDETTKYLKTWIAEYDKLARKQQIIDLIYVERNVKAAYDLAKPVLAEDPANVKILISLGYGGFLSNTDKDNSFDAVAAENADKAIRLIEAGKEPDKWTPFKGKDEALAYLNFTLGWITLKTDPDNAIQPLLKAARYDSDFAKSTMTYLLLGTAYETGPYARMSDEYKAKYGDKPETPESKQAFEKMKPVVDSMIDAYARAVALAGNNSKQQKDKTEWLARLKTYYKFRYDTDAGMDEFVAKALSRPLPAYTQ